MKIPFPAFIKKLTLDLHGPLPGRDAQHVMAPQPRSKPWKGSYDEPRADAKRGGVLMLFYPYTNAQHSQEREEIYLPLILRQTYDGVHSGQIGLPGGRIEDQDKDIIETALRETYEEVGVSSQNVHVIGQLSPLYVFASNFLVQPVVGWLEARPSFETDSHEVAELIETPLSALQNPDNLYSEMWELRDRNALVPHFRIQDHNVWGATAMMLSELLALPSVNGLVRD